MRYIRVCASVMCLVMFLLHGLPRDRLVDAVQMDIIQTEDAEEKIAGRLEISNFAAPDTEIPVELYFKIQVKLDGQLLPKGTCYMVGDETRIVDTAGELLLRVNETAVINTMIHSGAEYCITELSSSIDGYHAAYSCDTVLSEITRCTQDCISGIFSESGVVHVTITNEKALLSV